VLFFFSNVQFPELLNEYSEALSFFRISEILDTLFKMEGKCIGGVFTRSIIDNIYKYIWDIKICVALAIVSIVILLT